MVRGRGSGITRQLSRWLLAALVLSGCTALSGPTTVTTTPPLTTTITEPVTTTTQQVTTTTPPGSTSLPESTSVPGSTSTTVYYPLSDDAEIIVPEGAGPFPAVVLAHGGGWVGGSPALMRPLADRLAKEGFLTVNTPYTLANGRTGFPNAVHDLACSVRLAAAHPQGDGTVTILGHSAGAHLAAIVALSGEDYGAACPYPGTGVPERLIGLAGPYDVSLLGVIMFPFFGGSPEVEEEAWLAGNPHNLVDGNSGLRTLLLHGDADGIVDIGFSIRFARALEESDHEVLLETLEGADHMDAREPDVVADLIVTWLLR